MLKSLMHRNWRFWHISTLFSKHMDIIMEMKDWDLVFYILLVLRNEKWEHTVNGHGGWCEWWELSKVNGRHVDSQVSYPGRKVLVFSYCIYFIMKMACSTLFLTYYLIIFKWSNWFLWMLESVHYRNGSHANVRVGSYASTTWYKVLNCCVIFDKHPS